MATRATPNGSSRQPEPLPADPADRLASYRRRLDLTRLPAHVAIIMDGNGRWAVEHHLPSRLLGHREGYKTLRTIVRDTSNLGIAHLTVYVFSQENWRRPKHEIDGLMALIEQATRAELPDLHENNVRMRFIGRRADLSAGLKAEMERAESLTGNNKGLNLNLALNYGGRAEIADAARAIAEDVAAGKIAPADVDESAIAERLYAADLPDPDLLIRTAGEMRISNFLLWEIAYSEIWVTPTLWPDFTTELLVQAIEDYQGRVRKFGAVVSDR